MGCYPHDCKLCETNPRLRKDWGCDEESPSEIDRIPCSGGYKSLRRCPRKVVPQEAMEAIRYISLARSGMWPASGGALDQAQSFLDAHSVVLAEIAEIEKSDG